MTTILSKKKLIKVLSGEQNRLDKQLSQWQDLADCIRSDQVPASDVAKFFQDKKFFQWYRKKYLR